MKTLVTVDGYHSLKINSDSDLMYALANVGPVAVNVDATLWSSYSHGIFNLTDYSKNIDINHVVLAVGYGKDSTGAFWIIRNSWGTSYGENGYIRVQRDIG